MKLDDSCDALRLLQKHLGHASLIPQPSIERLPESSGAISVFPQLIFWGNIRFSPIYAVVKPGLLRANEKVSDDIII
jgi:hypothetical protein